MGNGGSGWFNSIVLENYLNIISVSSFALKNCCIKSSAKDAVVQKDHSYTRIQHKIVVQSHSLMGGNVN